MMSLEIQREQLCFWRYGRIEKWAERVRGLLVLDSRVKAATLILGIYLR